MAKAKKSVGRPAKESGIGKPVRVETSLVLMAKRIADFKGLALTDYASEALRPVIHRDYAAMLKALEEKGPSK